MDLKLITDYNSNDLNEMITESRAPEVNMLFQDKNTGSDKYLHVNTGDIVRFFENKGFIQRTTSRKLLSDSLGKHLVRMYNPNIDIGDGKLELIIGNSYDCSSCVSLNLGIFRLVCANGLVVGDSYGHARIKHLKVNSERLKHAYEEIAAKIDDVRRVVVTMQNKKISYRQRYKLAYRALRLRKFNRDLMPNYRQILRNLHNSNTIWDNFNDIQELLFKRGIPVLNGKNLRVIKNASRDIKLNQDLWRSYYNEAV